MGVWQQIAALPNPRYNAAAAFHNGKVYVAGGFQTFGGTWTSTLYVYDPGANTWSTGPALPTTGPCYLFSTAADGLHLIYPVTGAHYAIDLAAVTPAWATRTACPEVGRDDAHHFTDATGKLYLAGGKKTTTGNSVKVHRYDPATDTWTARADIPAGIADRRPVPSPGVLGSDSKIYLSNLAFVTGLTVYDPTADSWSTTTALPDTANPINVDLSRLPSGVVITLPHVNFDAAVSYRLRRIDGYDPATATWTMGVLPDYRGSVLQNPAIATDPAGLIYLVGGLDTFANPGGGGSVPSAESWAYLQNRAPTAPSPRTLTGGVLVSTGSTNRASWSFNDPDSGDSQSKLNFYYRPTGTTTWTTVTKTTPNAWYDIPAGTLDPVEYEWQVETYDAAGAISPRSTSAIFVADDPPDGPSITYPINAQAVEQFETVTWSTPVQDSYQLRRVADDAGDPDTGTVYFDTGEVVEPLTRALQVEFDVNDRFEHVQVRVKDGGLWSEWVDVQVDVSYTPPATPTFTAYADAATGSLLIMITNPDPGEDEPAAAYNDVYVDDGAGFERKVTDLATNTGWRYWTPKSGRDYTASIRVVAVAANGTTASSGGA